MTIPPSEYIDAIDPSCEQFESLAKSISVKGQGQSAAMVFVSEVNDLARTHLATCGRCRAHAIQVSVRPQRHRMSEGMRRLGIILGMVGMVGWILFVVSVADFASMQRRGWIFFLGGLPVAFGLTFGLICAIDWVAAGCRGSRSSG
jgi:hypothetical protein